MTAKPPTDHASAKPSRPDFRRRFDALEHERAALIDRISRLGEKAREHKSFKNAQILLNQTYRNGSLAQRLAILQAAAWLIGVLEKLSTAL